jgi:hypothetical protein
MGICVAIRAFQYVNLYQSVNEQDRKFGAIAAV